MRKVAVVTDTGADIPPAIAKALDIYSIPLQVSFGDRHYHDGIDITPGQFYQMLRESNLFPRTSQPSSGDFVEVYRRVSQSAASIISIHLSAALSGTIESAHQAKEQANLPVPIHIVDSRLVSIAQGFVVLAAAEMAAGGADAPEIVERLDALIPRINVLFVVDTLEYLHKGGRIGGAERLLGSLLSIKPLLEIAGGKIDALEKTRTKQRAMARLLDVISDRIGQARSVRFAVAHAAAEEDARKVKAEIEARFGQSVPYLCEISPVLGAHGGPGLFGVAFYVEET